MRFLVEKKRELDYGGSGDFIMKFKHFSKEEAIEVLTYLAADETFVSLKQVGEIKVDHVRELMRELAQHIEKEIDAERIEVTEMVADGLSAQARHLLSTLSPREERVMRRSFRLN